ncbi:dTDP-4-dehydrorhamnose reductase (plasmid) [Paracoccus sp. TK19116]|uniref:dTDP-4-dehydrorhamnose reductase n=1 Tax=Paracoccus albicereus TaxID=2922394 RepID=A0ABT1MLE4_9RHOB|nr:dTDP-4-dehydrorhamnose reductase [Paracoccus albicereus]MCQ0969120.1 dTDP-4-dehydrorhamnose reductase [Paracoccus albicereus]
MQGLLVFGKTGQVARELQRLAPDADYADRERADLARPMDCAALIRDVKPRLVINAAAFTAVDKAEDDEETARLANTESPAAMAEECAELSIPFLTVSTDYVFDGSGDRPWREDDETGPLGIYGSSKRDGEAAVAEAGGQSAILRTSWVFSAHGSNFVKTMLRLGAEKDGINVVADQIGGPTPAAAIARALLTMGEQMIGDSDKRGLYHFAGGPETSWAGFAREIFAQAGVSCDVNEIPTADYPTPAQRPLNSRLDCSRIEADFGIARPDWNAGLADVLAELKDSE